MTFCVHDFCDLFPGWGAVVFMSITRTYIEMFPVSVIDSNTTLVMYNKLFGGIHPIK